jgi:preprotein translocase subunit YajC
MPATHIPAQIAALLPAQPSAADAAANQLAGQATPSAGTTGGSGTPVGPPPPAGGGFPIMLVLLVPLGLIILMQVMSSKKDRRRRADLLSSIKKHDRVQTSGGIIGTIVEIRDEDVLLKVDEGSNTRIRFAKSAIQQVVRGASGGGDHADTATVETKPKSEKAAV